MIKLHALHDIDRGLRGLRLLHRDRPFGTDLFHGVGHEITHDWIIVCGDGRDL